MLLVPPPPPPQPISARAQTFPPWCKPFRPGVNISALAQTFPPGRKLHAIWREVDHCPDSARTQGANERVVLCLMNELVADHERVL